MPDGRMAKSLHGDIQWTIVGQSVVGLAGRAR